MKLFCLPYAGGSAVVYNRWKNHLNNEIQLVPIELAGKGSRINEPLYKSRKQAVEDVFGIVKTQILQSPYMIFGHSMGALMTLELTHKIRENNLPKPLHLFFSGASAPHLRDDKKTYHLLGPDEFEKEIVGLGGTPPEFFEHKELMEMFLPILKNDFKMTETDLPDNYDNPLEVDFTVFQGKKDDLTPEQQEDWSKHTNKNFELQLFEGGHFFLHDEIAKITSTINQLSAKKVNSVNNI